MTVLSVVAYQEALCTVSRLAFLPLDELCRASQRSSWSLHAVCVHGTMDKLHWAEAVAAGTPPVTYLHLDIEPLTAVFSLWLLLSSQFLVCGIVRTKKSVSLWFIGKDVVWNCIKGLQKSGEILLLLPYPATQSPCCRWQPD